MAYDPENHNRRSIRLPAYDYTRSGAYFITICTHDRHCLFGTVSNGRMHPNEYGRIAADEWRRTGDLRDTVRPDAFVVMPDHVHGIVIIVADGAPGADDGNDSDRVTDRGNRSRGTARRVPTSDGGVCSRQFGAPTAGSLPTIVRAYKSAVTKRINERRDTPGASVWQRNYYERIIRGRRGLHAVRRYIRRNPARWHHDRITNEPKTC